MPTYLVRAHPFEGNHLGCLYGPFASRDEAREYGNYLETYYLTSGYYTDVHSLQTPYPIAYRKGETARYPVPAIQDNHEHLANLFGQMPTQEWFTLWQWAWIIR